MPSRSELVAKATLPTYSPCRRCLLEFSDEVAPDELHHHDIIHFALNELQLELQNGKQPELLERLKQHLREIKEHRFPQPPSQ